MRQRIILKGDVRGTVEALQGVLRDLGTSEVAINVLHSGVGGIKMGESCCSCHEDVLADIGKMIA